MGSVEEKQRLKDLLKDTITLLCKNGLEFQLSCSVEALIGITLDGKNVILININETLQSLKAAKFSNGTSRKRPYSCETSDGKDRSISGSSRKKHRDANSGQKKDAHKEFPKTENEIDATSSAHKSKLSLAVKEEPKPVFSDQTAQSEFDSYASETLPHVDSYSNSMYSVHHYGVADTGYDMILTSQQSDTCIVDASAKPLNAATFSYSNKALGESSSSSRLSSGSGNVMCEHCFQEFKFKQTLRDHLRNRHGIGEPFVCECGEKIMDRRKFAQHRKRHELDVQAQSVESNDTNSYMEAGHQCPEKKNAEQRSNSESWPKEASDLTVEVKDDEVITIPDKPENREHDADAECEVFLADEEQ